MPHFKSFFDPGEFLGCADLDGRDVTVQIESVSQGKVGRGKQASKKPVIAFVGKTKKFACNVTNGTTIAKLYGSDVAKWKGCFITLFPTTTQFGGETVECLRVRPIVPEARGRSKAQAADAQAERDREEAVRAADRAADLADPNRANCPACAGKGADETGTECQYCGGDGRVMADEVIGIAEQLKEGRSS